MEVRVLVRFRDLEDGVIREIGDLFFCTEERYQEILKKGKYVEKVEDPGEEPEDVPEPEDISEEPEDVSEPEDISEEPEQARGGEEKRARKARKKGQKEDGQP